MGKQMATYPVNFCSKKIRIARSTRQKYITNIVRNFFFEKNYKKKIGRALKSNHISWTAGVFFRNASRIKRG